MNNTKRRECRRQKRHEKQEWKQQAYREITIEDGEDQPRESRRAISKINK